MCSLTIECFPYYRVCSFVFSYYSTCSFTIECLLLLKMHAQVRQSRQRSNPGAVLVASWCNRPQRLCNGPTRLSHSSRREEGGRERGGGRKRSFFVQRASRRRMVFSRPLSWPLSIWIPGPWCCRLHVLCMCHDPLCTSLIYIVGASVHTHKYIETHTCMHACVYGMCWCP